MNHEFGSLFEAAFRQAVIDNHYRELEDIPCEAELAEKYIFSQAHEDRMKKLFAMDRRKDVFRYISKWLKRTAAIIAIVTTLLSAVILSTPEGRALVVNKIIEWYDKFTQFYSPNSTEEGFLGSWSPSYLPKGFAEAGVVVVDFIHIVIFSDVDGNEINFTYFPQGDAISVDNEGKEYYTVIDNDIEYYIFEGVPEQKESSIVWDMGNVRLRLRSDLPVEELLKIAKSVCQK